MKIKLVTGQNIYFAAKNAIAEINSTDLDAYSYVIVPDRFSLQTENLIMDELNLNCTFNIEVMGLSRLAYRVLNKIGVKGDMLSNDEILLLTQQAIENVKHQFLSFKKNSINFAQEVSKVIAQIKSSGITPKEMVSKNCPKSTENKFHDLALIYEEYEKLIAGRLDSNKLLILFANILENSQILKDVDLYFVGFDSFTSEMFSILITLAKSAASVTIAYPKASNITNSYIFEDDILQKLTNLCKQEKIMIEVKEKQSPLTPIQQKIIYETFSGKQKSQNVDMGLTSLLCKNANEEVLTCGKLINNYIRGGGRYKDINIACSNLESYMPLINRIFDELDIPYFADVSVTADKLMLSQAVDKFLKVVSSGYSKDALIDYFLCPINGNNFSKDIVAEILRLNIKGKAKTFKYLAKLCKNELNLFNLLEKCAVCKDFCQIIKQWLEFVKPNFDSVVSDMEKDYAAEKNLNAQAEQNLLNALDSILSIQAEYPITIFEFIKKLHLLLSFNQVSTVPTYVDSVMIGDATSSYFVPTKRLFILSGSESLPSTAQDNGLVTDNDIENLHYIKAIEPTIRMINRRNRFKLFNLLAMAQEKLYVTFKVLNDEGKKIEKPSFITDLCNVFGQDDIKASFLFNFLSSDLNNFVAGLGSKQHAIRILAGNKNLSNTAFTSIEKAVQFDVKKLNLSRQFYLTDAKALFFPKNYTKVTQLENYFSCPFKHFVRYGLKLNEKSNNEFEQRDIGNICHLFAQIFVEQNLKNAQNYGANVDKFIEDNFDVVLKQLKLDEKLEICDEKYILTNMIKRQCKFILSHIIYEQKYSHFKPIYLEKQLQDLKISVENHDQTISMQGKVDRIDRFGDYFRIIDYKTGKVEPLVKDLFYGDKLQLFIYQKGVAQMLSASPSGVFYFDCKMDFYDEEGGPILKGLVASEDEVINASDTRLGVLEKSDILAVATRKQVKDDCAYKGSAVIKGSLLTLQDYASAIASKALGQLFDGYIEPKPDEDACESCAFKGICLFDDKKGRRQKSKKSFADIEKALKGDCNE